MGCCHHDFSSGNEDKKSSGVSIPCACGHASTLGKKQSLMRVLWAELLCHLPYTVLSVICGFVVISACDFLVLLSGHTTSHVVHGYHMLFHVFHYMHILFAVIGSHIMFMRFSKHYVVGYAVSIFGPMVLCTISDVILPAASGVLLGMPMDMHICFFYPLDFLNMVIFAIIGLCCAYALERERVRQYSLYGIGMHFFHILSSALAALFYMVSFGFEGWVTIMGPMFLFLMLSVIVPCLFSDIIVPVFAARQIEKRSITKTTKKCTSTYQSESAINDQIGVSQNGERHNKEES
ncbi:MAG: hypothetical protein UU47_C0002G0037 [candidate division TM6 bacterium GW2011_GWE2_41_16]|nr:MAG: hypothetical protein UU47_C0002G0037 [candidate division TM6 bacterium GW2011_GWE2_41_16]